jgi:hypothetical protein
LTGFRQYTKYLKLREVGIVLLPVIYIFKLFKEVKAAKFKLGKGVSKEINIDILDIIKK